MACGHRPPASARDVADLVAGVVRHLAADGTLPLRGDPGHVPPTPPFLHPAGSRAYTSVAAFRLVHVTGRSAPEIAHLLADRLRQVDGIVAAEAREPGFLTVVLPPPDARLAAAIVAAGPDFGRSDALAGRRLGADADADGHRARPRAVTGAGLERWRREVVAASVARLLEAAGARPGVGVGVDRAPAVADAGYFLDLVGTDAGRYAAVREHARTRLDPGRWGRQADANPAYRVRRLHARARALVRRPPQLAGVGRRSQHTASEAGDLRAALADLPDVIAYAAEEREPYRLPLHLEEVANRFETYAETLPPHPGPGGASDDPMLLVEATATVLANGLRLMGVSAPTRM